MENGIGSTGPRLPHERGGEQHPVIPDAARAAIGPTPAPDNGALDGFVRRSPLTAARRGVRELTLLPLRQREELRYRRALTDVADMPEAASAKQFIERYLLGSGSLRTADHRMELVARLARRIPVMAETSDAAELEGAFRAMLDTLERATEATSEQRSKPFIVLLGAAHDVPGSARDLRAEAHDCAWAAWKGGAIDDGDYAEILAAYARAVTSADLLDPRLLDGLKGGKSQRASDRPADLGSPPAARMPHICDRHDAEELAIVFFCMLELVDTMSGEQQREWLSAVVQAAGCLHGAPIELVAVWDAILKVVRAHPETRQRMPLVELAEATINLPRGAIQHREEVLAFARTACQDAAIDVSDYADILAHLARSTASADLFSGEQLVDGLVREMGRIPAPIRGRLYGCLFTPELVRQRHPESRQLFCFNRAFAGLMQLNSEHAEDGFAMLRHISMLRAPELKLSVVKSMLDAAEGPRRDLRPLLMREMAPIIDSLPSDHGRPLLTRALSTVDGDAGVSAGAFLTVERAAHCEQIFDHMYPIAMTVADDSVRANELAALAVLASRLKRSIRGDDLYARFDQVASGLDGVPMPFRFESLRRLQELAGRLPSESSERAEAFGRLQRLGADELRLHETAEAWLQAFPPPMPTT